MNKPFPKWMPWFLLALILGSPLLYALGFVLPFEGTARLASLASWSLIIGVIGSLIAAIWAVKAISSAERRQSSGILAPITTIVIAACILITLAWTAISTVIAIRETGYRRGCGSNLAQLGRILRSHATTNDGHYATTFSHVIPSESEHLLHCPSERTHPNMDATVDLWTSYVLIPGRKTNDAPNTVLVYCPISKHSGKNKIYCVLFVDGRILWLHENEYMRLTKNEEK